MQIWVDVDPSIRHTTYEAATPPRRTGAHVSSTFAPCLTARTVGATLGENVAPTNDDVDGVLVEAKSVDTVARLASHVRSNIATPTVIRCRTALLINHQLHVMELHCLPVTHEPMG